MTLLASVARTLEAQHIAYAVIGATAMAVHGVTRSTADLDLLATDTRCLDPALWAPLRDAGTVVDLRRGDDEDPLAGVIRFERGEEPPVDVLVGRWPWQREILGRAMRIEIGGVSVPVAAPADLILLKLYAGGPQDAWDIAQLLDAVPGLEPLVEAGIGALPPDCAALWRRIRAGRP